MGQELIHVRVLERVAGFDVGGAGGGRRHTVTLLGASPSGSRPDGHEQIGPPAMKRLRRSAIELCQYLADDLGRLVSRQNVTALGLRYLSSERLDGMHATDEHVA